MNKGITKRLTQRVARNMKFHASLAEKVPMNEEFTEQVTVTQNIKSHEIVKLCSDKPFKFSI